MSSVQEPPNTPQDDAHAGSIYHGSTCLKPNPHSPDHPVELYNGSISVLEDPFPNGLTYIFFWSADDELSYHVGNLIQGGNDNYDTRTIRVQPRNKSRGSDPISNNNINAPLASARTSDGKIHLFYSDNSQSKGILTDILLDPDQSVWTFGSLSALGLKVPKCSGIGAWSEPILKVVLYDSDSAITEAWWDTLNLKWKSFVLR